MLDLTFGEQVKIILRRKGMTIKELAEIMEAHTGKKMSRQNLTQRLGRDNFQEQDMRQIAEILGCRFQLSIMEESVSAEKNFNEEEQNIEIENIAVEQVYDEPVSVDVPSVEEVQEEVQEEVIVEAPVEEVHEESAEELAIAIEDVYEEPVYEEAYEEPVYEEVYEEPVYEEAVYEEPVYEEVYEQQAEASVEDALKEMENLAQEDKAYKAEKEQKAKKKGWRDRFGFNRKEEPVKEEAAVEVPVQEEPVYEEPVYEEAAYEEPMYEEAAYEEGVYEEPAYEEAAYEEPAYEEPVYEEPVGEINPYTGREYETNSVRVHPKKIGFVQVYDGDEHKWIEMTEWAFMGYQEQKKMLLGKDYDPPIYLD